MRTKHRACRALLCLVLAISLLLPMTVGALAGSTTIGTDASRPEYFEALGASGNYNPLKTPYHYDKTTGNVAYCLEHKKDSPSSSAEYTDFDASALWGQNTVTGIQAIVDHGYPNSNGGLSEEQAHYATANAIRAWMKESADVGDEFMRVDKGHVRPLSGTAAQQTWDFFLELLGYARAGNVLSGGGGTVRVSPREATWEVDGDVLRACIEVISSDGYALSSHEQVSVSGYTGGTVPNPTYEQVCTGRTGHAEAVRVTYDPAKVSFEELARLFFEIHDPTQINRQGPDIGTQYRSAIFYKDERQKATALSLMEKLREHGYAVATELLPASTFYPAEAYHQDFTARTGRGGCHLRVFRFGV